MLLYYEFMFIELNRNTRRKSRCERTREIITDAGDYCRRCTSAPIIIHTCAGTLHRFRRTRNFYYRQQRIIRFLFGWVCANARAWLTFVWFIALHIIYSLFRVSLFFSRLQEFVPARTMSTTLRFRNWSWITLRLIFFRSFCQFAGVIFVFLFSVPLHSRCSCSLLRFSSQFSLFFDVKQNIHWRNWGETKTECT